MSSSIETIGQRLQSLEERLQKQNEWFGGQSTPPPLPPMETTPNRQNRKMFLPVISSPPAAETETDRKLKKIMKQTGILTINGEKYATDVSHLEHLGDLGNGTSGNVVKMRHKPSGTIIAVKQMRRTGNTEENKRILMDLDVVLKSHDCPYIVQCLGCFVRDPDVWICMELMSMCFDKLLKLSKKPVPEEILGKVTVATVKALAYLKDKHGVIHRDVKPSNILIDERGNIKLCDFGISGRLVDSKANTRSAGCAAYMAPERIDPKKPKYDIRADVWSLGITLVELATARSPYEGCNNDFEVLTKVLESDPPSLPYDGFNFSTEFRDFVSKCLTKNHLYRPKYPELLDQPFIKIYEAANVDVPKWFQSVVEAAGLKSHYRSILPSRKDSIKSNNSYSTSSNNSKRCLTTQTTTTAAASNQAPTTTTISTGNVTTPTTAINTNAILSPTSLSTINTKKAYTQLPNYYQVADRNQLHLGNLQQQHNITNSQYLSLDRYKSENNQQQLIDTIATTTTTPSLTLPLSNLPQQQQATAALTTIPTIITSQQHLYNNNNVINNRIRGTSPIPTAATTKSAAQQHHITSRDGGILDGNSSGVRGFNSGCLNLGSTWHAHVRSESSSSAASSSSPQSPPSITCKTNTSPSSSYTSPIYDDKIDTVDICNEMNKLYQNSPNLQRKYSGKSARDYSKGESSIGFLSPKKETTSSSMFSNIGQSIIRNLTISPFSQKKHQAHSLQQKNESLASNWQQHPLAQDTQIIGRTKTNYSNSPILGRKGFTGIPTATTAYESQQLQNRDEYHVPSLIPINKYDANQVQKVPGNQSPIVLQRFYHQQNQLREKEEEKLYQRQYEENQLASRLKISPEDYTKNLRSQDYSNHGHHSHIPISIGGSTGLGLPATVAVASSSHSTSSQSSSTQSSSSQILNASYVPNNYDGISSSVVGSNATTAGFGIGAAYNSSGTNQLQYQPLPQQYISKAADTRSKISNGAANDINSKLNKFYNRYQSPVSSKTSVLPSSLSSTSSSSSPSTSALTAAGEPRTMLSGAGVFDVHREEDSIKNEFGWFNSLTGVMKKQFTTYFTSQLNFSANTTSPKVASSSSTLLTASTTPTTTQHIPSSANATGALGNKNPLPFYRSISSDNGGSSYITNNSAGHNNRIPTYNSSSLRYDGMPRSSSIRPEIFYDDMRAGSEFTGGAGGGSVLRRYAAANNGVAHMQNNNTNLLNNYTDRRHRSPDPPPRFNRGRSPLLLRKNLLELSGQPPGTQHYSPLFNRRFVSASPPLLPPRRGSESVPGSPQHFRTRVHYTPEPQRRIYRTIDQ